MTTGTGESSKPPTPAPATGTVLSASKNWSRAMPPGPDSSVKITEEYAKLVARDVYFWAWAMVNVYNRRLYFSRIKEKQYGGPSPQAPLNEFTMLTDYAPPEQRNVACANQDVVYGIGALALDISPVVIQVPDFGDRFWVYQIVDLRTDSFVQMGKMYNTTPGFYLLVGPDWQGDLPRGVTKVFRCSTNTGLVGPRVAQDDDPQDKKAVQEPLKQVLMYPLAQYDGKMKSIDWASLPRIPAKTASKGEAKWVVPETFFDVLPAVLADGAPLPGEEARYAQVLAVLEAAGQNPGLKLAMARAAAEVDEQVVAPLLQFRNYGQQLAHCWSTISNESAFGTDYFTRTAVARSNILVNSPYETKYYYQDLDQNGGRLNGSNRYRITFAKDQTPPCHGFWSLTLYDEEHFFVPNEIGRYSVGTKNKDLHFDADGSLTIHVRPSPPSTAEERANWLPSPKDGDFTLYIRAYWPKAAVLDGSWRPPPVETA
jgi:hypothetical protein